MIIIEQVGGINAPELGSVSTIKFEDLEDLNDYIINCSEGAHTIKIYFEGSKEYKRVLKKHTQRCRDIDNEEYSKFEYLGMG